MSIFKINGGITLVSNTQGLYTTTMSVGNKACRGGAGTPVVLAILDGVALADRGPYNAVTLANTPTLDRLFDGPLFTTLKAHGRAVGMPSDDDMGNSEVGHNTLGAGRVVNQGARLVNDALVSGCMFASDAWQSLIQPVIETNKTFHLIGLLSDGNVHSHMDHVHALVQQCANDGIQRLRLHALLDGRDVPARSALGYVAQLTTWLDDINRAHGVDFAIASGGGRMLITMDRYGADWPMVARGWQTHVLGQGPQFDTATAAIEHAYSTSDVIDQYIPPFVIAKNHQPIGPIVDGDSVVLFNFRGDRAIELSMAFEADDFTHFNRERRPNVQFAGMMQYDGDLCIPTNYLVSPPHIDGPVAHVMCQHGIKTLAISETQKYGHVTFFWNGNNSGKVDPELEDYVEIESDNRPFNEQPAMKAKEITDHVCNHINDYDFIRINYPNGDMVGHTADLDAAILAMEAVDQNISRLEQAVAEAGGTLVVVADHGNADDMTKTAHTLNPVPFKIVTNNPKVQLANVASPGLANVASTLCMLLGIQPPSHYDPSLIKLNP